jgi:hypothetical protein
MIRIKTGRALRRSNRRPATPSESLTDPLTDPHPIPARRTGPNPVFDPAAAVPPLLLTDFDRF